MEVILFSVFALLSLASAIVVVAHRNPVYSTMSLVVTLVSVAALFVMLGAPFIAALQVLIYTGAILVLFLFVIMLLNIQREERADAGGRGQRWGAVVCAAALGGFLILLFWSESGGAALAALSADFVSLKTVARLLFSDYMLPFQMTGLLLLAAVTGATILARRNQAARGAKEAE